MHGVVFLGSRVLGDDVGSSLLSIWVIWSLSISLRFFSRSAAAGWARSAGLAMASSRSVLLAQLLEPAPQLGHVDRAGVGEFMTGFSTEIGVTHSDL
jgi:hypothetical protein